MHSIAEQIHAYRALKTRESAATRTQITVSLPASAKPSDYFRLLMNRWQNDYVRRILRAHAVNQ